MEVGAVVEALAGLDWVRGEGDAVVDRLLARAGGGGAFSVVDVAAIALSHSDATDAQLERVREALAAAVPSVVAWQREGAESDLEEIEDALAYSRPG